VKVELYLLPLECKEVKCVWVNIHWRNLNLEKLIHIVITIREFLFMKQLTFLK